MSNKKSLSILVTGSSSGFGKLTAKTLAKAGHQVFASMRGVTGKNEDKAQQFRDWAAEENLHLEVVELDITDQNSVDNAMRSILEKAGRIDVVVNNAGTGNVGVLEGYTIEQMQQIFDVNVFGAFRVDKAVLPLMRRQGSGLLIHVSSTAGRIAVPFVSPYAAAKHALEAIAEEFSFELAPFGVESVLIEPGSFGTEAFGKLFLPADDEALAGYGEMATQPQAMFSEMAAMLSRPGAPDPQLVADAVQAVIEAPVGERPLRTVVGPLTTAGMDSLNKAYVASKQELLAEMGAA
ncbi:MAG: SDR family oxidoreductase [Anaerolineae bacterium]